MKKRIVLCILTFIILIGSIFYFCWNKSNKGYSTSYAISCSARQYEEKNDFGYLTVVITSPKGDVSKTIIVEDSEIRAQIASIDLEEIIGAHIFLEIPPKVISDHHIDVKTIDSMYLLTETSMYDDYFRIAGISVEESAE